MLIKAVTDFLEDLAPTRLAEEWDNVGLLLGDDRRDASAVMTCLTLTPDVAREAVEGGAQLVVSHHPILFRPVRAVTAHSSEGRMLLELTAAQIAVYSPHTGYDSASEGINRQLAELFELTDVGVLRPEFSDDIQEIRGRDAVESSDLGAGRCGRLKQPVTLSEFIGLVKERLPAGPVSYVGDPEAMLERVGIACGSAAEFLPDARENGCQALLTGEARFHAALEARTLGMGLVLAGHYATERPAMERLAETLAARFPELSVWASRRETDPLKWG